MKALVSNPQAHNLVRNEKEKYNYTVFQHTQIYTYLVLHRYSIGYIGQKYWYRPSAILQMYIGNQNLHFYGKIDHKIVKLCTER